MSFWITIYVGTEMIRYSTSRDIADSSFALEFQQEERLDVSKDCVAAEVDEEHLVDPGEGLHPPESPHQDPRQSRARVENKVRQKL